MNPSETSMKLTEFQRETLRAAQRAHARPDPENGWIEQRILSELPARSKDKLERIGLIGSYLANDGKTRYRLTEYGLAWSE